MAVLLAFTATLLSLPVNATVSFPNEPLTTGARVPPNVLFIMDDSGSMAWRYMYNPAISQITGGGITSGRTGNNTSSDSSRGTDYTSDNGIYDQNYITNTLYYNPAIDYQPWFNSNGEPLAGGASFNAAYSSSTYVQDSASGTTSSTINLSNNTQVFYVPKPGITNYADVTQYYRYHIRTDGRVVRSERLQGNGSNNGVSGVGCSTNNSGWGWRACTYVTPTGRSEAAEKANFATWYSYHRTRTKAAKAGASAAFGELGEVVRVGFRTIWGRNGSSTSGNIPTQNVPIPINYNSGLFANPNGVSGMSNNRERWYNRLFASQASDGTPLRSALNNAGFYFSSREATGPYGPESGGSQLACRQNFTILTTDGFWNSDSGFSSGGNQDGTNGAAITRPDGPPYTYEAGPPYSDSRQNTLADVAMRYWKNDLRTDLPNIVPNTTVNPAFWQHMVTFGISIGLRGTTGFTSVADVPSNYSSWPDPLDNEDADRIDDLLHAAVNSRGTFLSASNPREFAEGLEAALAAIVERTGSFSNVAANSTSLDAGTRLFQANYVSGVWTGDVLAYARNAAGTGFESTPAWRASQGIPKEEEAAARKVYTSSGRFPDSATPAQLGILQRVSDYPVSGDDNAAYIAGSQLDEMSKGGNLRNRNHLLGDIVNSSPVYVPDTDTLYVGANDGMLHAFDAANGSELFAFIPNGINWADLGSLSRPDYSHRYFVDGPIIVSSRRQTPDKNILVGTLGRGGKGVFALDVTNPDLFSASRFLWEDYETPDGNMGQVLGRPVIAKLNNGVTAAIVSNGVNSSNGRAVLLVYNLMSGELIEEIDTGAGPIDSISNGLSGAVGWDRDANGTVDYVYAGDMHGNVWKFDLTSGTPSDWEVDFGGQPLFTAVGPDGTTRQPITGGLTVALHPTTYRPWVFFGTGRFMTIEDPANMAVQGLYGIEDIGARVTSKETELIGRRVMLVTTSDGRRVRAFEQNQSLPAGYRGWYVDLLDPPAPGTPIGERIATAPQMSGSALVVSSIIPSEDPCEYGGSGYLNAVDAFTGTSTGSPFFDVDEDGEFADDVVEGVDEDGNPVTLPIGSIDLGIGMPTESNLLGGGPGSDSGEACAAGSTGEVGCVDTDEMRNVGRVSWREVIRN
ncbi:pilus assembly protein [Luteimonas sp. R10]|uniref:pilus assembly protein n=1 Tax=Luteimonas sp. R10 TaxID=3108176 RepID=UPI003084F806|nr:PilC/PilY family type IV pilus protein [Luteimonas sp. R10]